MTISVWQKKIEHSKEELDREKNHSRELTHSQQSGPNPPGQPCGWSERSPEGDL